MTGTRPWRFMLWLARDYFLWAGVATFVIMIFAGAFLTEGYMAVGPGGDPRHPLVGLSVPQLRGIEVKLLLALSTVGPVVATMGIVSTDRRLGYFRLLFARPVSGAGYYSIAFILNGIGFLLVSIALLAVFSTAIAPVAAPRFVLVIAVSYLLLGGITFLWSAIWRHDLLGFVSTYVAAAMTWDVLSSDGYKGWLAPARPILSLLPPVHRQGELVFAIPLNGEIAWPALWWVVAYGMACFGLSVVILRRRQFGEYN